MPTVSLEVLLKQMTAHGGVLYSSDRCTEMMIAFAQKDSRFAVDEDGKGYVYNPNASSENLQIEVVAWCERLVRATAECRGGWYFPIQVCSESACVRLVELGAWEEHPEDFNLYRPKNEAFL